MIRKPLGLVAGLIFWAGLALPCPSPAGTITGTWTGGVVFDIQYSVNAAPAGESWGRYLGEMSLTYDPEYQTVSMIVSGNPGIQLIDIPYSSDPFGPTYGTGELIAPPFDYGSYEVANFAVSYRSILPDGTIDTSGGFANADVVMIWTDPMGNGGNEYLSFQTVPEPPSIVPAAFAFLIATIIGLKRLLRPR
ncbi:MAG: hypothetical protein ACP5XB_10600 [Isosphaeraceae bacterium]